MRMILLPNQELLQGHFYKDGNNSFAMRQKQRWEERVIQNGTII